MEFSGRCMEINRGEMRIDVGRRVDVAYMQWISGRGVKTIDGGCVERYLHPRLQRIEMESKNLIHKYHAWL